MKVILAIAILVLAMLACGQPAPEHVLRGWTVTPSLFANTLTPTVPTQTPYIIEITNTPEPTGEPVKVCVSAQEAVNLRPSASEINYPILTLENGAQVQDLGGRSGKWWFVRVDDKDGWINSDFLRAC